ncbi:hypothetical protein KFK09_000593 [Dendrobium nobile]|uniref:RRM domain-containing protein n=1 Tax=Dendrobium nobile TaxID=94219 RepID=A0A8T3C901_DENNO|nr:hypothetical protein KFK09_000593 [Dendrobium nobile]
MMKQSDIVNSKSPEEFGSYGNSDDEFEEYSEEEMLSEEESNENLCFPPNKEGSIDKLSKVEGSCAEEPNEYVSSDEESTEEVPCGDESDEEDSCPEESNEENLNEGPEAASAEYPTEGMTLEEASDEDLTDVSFEEIIEEEFYEESYEEPDEEEPLKGSMDQIPLAIISDGVSNSLEQKKASDHAFSESITSVESSCNQSLRESSNLPIDALVSKQRDDPSASIKKRRSRWDIKAEAPMPVNESGDLGIKRTTRWSSDTKAEAPILVNDNADLKKRRKTRWSSDETQLNMPCTLKLLDSVKDISSNTDNDQRIRRLNAEIQAINRKLGGSVIVNEQPQEESSPSPQPNDDCLDSRIYTSEFRHLVSLLKQKLSIISELTKSQKNDKPSNHTIFKKKLYLPVKEYPNYNFIGLILGPNGNSLKKMEKETGATIVLRGKGFSSKDKKNQCSDDNDDEHVLIQSDSRNGFDAAVSMVEKLLVPVDDRHNYYKSAQLRELAELRGNLKEVTFWDVKQCDICGKSSHQTSDCPLVATELQSNANFHTGSGSLFSSFKSSSASPSPLPFVANAFGDKPQEESKPVTLFVGHLSLSVSKDKLKELFLPYGDICYVSVLMDKSTGQSKGCGFVRYTSASDAAVAIAKMNGCMVDGKKLTVKIAGACSPSLFADLPNYPGFASIPPPSLNTDLPNFPGLASIPPPSSNANLPNFLGTPHPSSSNANLPKYPELSAIAEMNPKPNYWPGPPGSMLLESGISYPKSSFNSSNYTESVPLQSSTSFGSTFQTTSLGKNGRMIDGKVTVTGSPSPSLNANLPNYPGFVAIPRDIPESNCLPCPSASIPPASGTFLSNSRYNLLNHTESVPFRSSTYLGSTCQTSISTSQFPGVAATSNELATFPGFLKSFDSSNQLNPSMPSSSLSSPSPYFIRNFSSQQMNPTWR